MQLLSGEPRVEQPFFPVSKVRVRATDTGHSFRRHWTVVADDRREVFAILEVRPPAELPRNAGRRDAWVRLGPWLRGLGDKYRNELGATAYALVNAATDYASDSNAPLMSPGRVDALQVRSGRWTDWTLERYGAALASQLTVEIEVTKEGRNAADRLAAMERAGT